MVDWSAVGNAVKKGASVAAKAIPVVSNILGGLGNLGIFGKSNSATKAAQQQYQYNLALQQQAQQWNEYMYRNRYQMQVEDLEKAGINKLYGLGSAPSSSMGATSTGMPDMVGESNAKMQAGLTLLNLAREWSATSVNNKLQTAQTATEQYNTLLKREEYLTQQITNKNLDKRQKTEIEQMLAETRKAMAQTAEAFAGASLKRVSTKNVNEDTKLKARRNKWYENNPKLGELAIGAQEMEPIARVGGKIAEKGIDLLLRKNRKNSANRKGGK